MSWRSDGDRSARAAAFQAPRDRNWNRYHRLSRSTETVGRSCRPPTLVPRGASLRAARQVHPDTAPLAERLAGRTALAGVKRAFSPRTGASSGSIRYARVWLAEAKG